MPGATYKKPFWDFSEKKNYILYASDNNEKFNIVNTGTNEDKRKRANKLLEIKRIIQRMGMYLINNRDKWENTEARAGAEIFLEIHNPNNYRGELNTNGTWKIAEMQPHTGFWGLNKPKNIVKTQKEHVGLDKNKRATWRYVFLTLHENDDKLINLLLHELAHTACNHVTYRDKENHLADFDFYEQFLHEIYILSM